MPFTAFFARVKRSPAAALRVVRGVGIDIGTDGNGNRNGVHGIPVDEPIFLPMIESTSSSQQQHQQHHEKQLHQPQQESNGSYRRLRLTNSVRAQRASSSDPDLDLEITAGQPHEQERDPDVPPFPLTESSNVSPPSSPRTPPENSEAREYDNETSDHHINDLNTRLTAQNTNGNGQERNQGSVSISSNISAILLSPSHTSPSMTTDLQTGRNTLSPRRQKSLQQYQQVQAQRSQHQLNQQHSGNIEPSTTYNVPGAVPRNGNGNIHKMAQNQQLYQRQVQKLPSETSSLRREIHKLLAERAEVLRIIATVQGKNPSDITSHISVQQNDIHIRNDGKQLPMLLRETIQRLRDEKNELRQKLFLATAQTKKSDLNLVTESILERTDEHDRNEQYSPDEQRSNSDVSSSRRSTLPGEANRAKNKEISNVTNTEYMESQEESIHKDEMYRNEDSPEPRSVKLITPKPMSNAAAERSSRRRSAAAQIREANSVHMEREQDGMERSNEFYLTGGAEVDDQSDDDYDIEQALSRVVKSEPSSLEKGSKIFRVVKDKERKKWRLQEVNALLKLVYDERKSALLEKNRLVRELQSTRGEAKKLREQAIAERRNMLEIKIKQRDSSSKAMERLKKLQKERDSVKRALEKSIQEKNSLLGKIKVLNNDVKEAESILNFTRLEMRHMYAPENRDGEDGAAMEEKEPRTAGSASNGRRDRDRGSRAHVRHDDFTNRILVRELRKRGEELTKKVENLRSQYGETSNQKAAEGKMHRQERWSNAEKEYLHSRLRQRGNIENRRIGQPRSSVQYHDRSTRGEREQEGNESHEFVRVVDLDSDIEIEDLDLDFLEGGRSAEPGDLRRLTSSFDAENLELEEDIVFVYQSDDDVTTGSSECSTSIRLGDVKLPPSRRPHPPASRYSMDN